MSVNAKQLREHMQKEGLDKIVVEVVDVNVPKVNYEKPRVLAKRLVIFSVNDYGKAYYIRYAMYNSFKRSECYVPNDFQFEILGQAAQMMILNEYQQHKDGLEKAFRDAFNETHDVIQDKLATAKALIKEAEQLSNESGVPFNAPTGLLQYDASYTPRSFDQKFGGNDEVRDLMVELTELFEETDGGWNSPKWDSSSANC